MSSPPPDPTPDPHDGTLLPNRDLDTINDVGGPVPLLSAETAVGWVTTSGGEPPPPVVPGYEILTRLGRGAAGVVYKARQVKLKRTVALKVMIGYAHESREQLARFHDEAVIVAQLQHPNVIQIFDIGEQDGVPFLATEYMDGGTLEGRLRAGGRMEIGEAVRTVYQIARGVGAAHTRGVVHRDLKPANILLTADGTPKVADFGLAKVLGAESNTVTGSILGTPAYMSPEQAAGQVRRIGPQADVYALGVILYECLTGGLPYTGNSVMELLDKVRTMPPPPVRVRRDDVPDALEEVLLRCMRKIPTERYSTADALADDLMRIAAGPRPKTAPPPTNSSGGVYLVLTAITLVGVIAVAAWLFAPLIWPTSTAPTSPTTAPSPTVQFAAP